MFLYRSCSIKNKEKISKILRKRVKSFYNLNFSEKNVQNLHGIVEIEIDYKVWRPSND